MQHEELTKAIIGCAYRVYNTLGAGFLESVYERSLLIELQTAGLLAEPQVGLDVYYREIQVGRFFADIIVEDTVIIELKAVDELAKIHEVQLVNYLVATGKPIGLLINFGPDGGEDGQQYLSRAGAFELDTQGRLVTQNGQRPVLDQQGAEITLSRDVPFSISQDGFISQAGNIVALGMSQPESLNELVKVGNNMWEPTGPVKPLALDERNLRQGYLELSGANSVRQMMAMIETTRAFEANTRMIQNQDSVLGSLIGRVLRA